MRGLQGAEELNEGLWKRANGTMAGIQGNHIARVGVPHSVMVLNQHVGRKVTQRKGT
jgi:hypothetical protein